MPPPLTHTSASRWRSSARFAGGRRGVSRGLPDHAGADLQLRQPRSARFGGDARAFIWVLAWDNHAVLDRVPSLFDANKLYPLPNALAYGEHLFGISLFTLPIYALTRIPVLAYNVVWILCYLLAAGAAHALAWRYTRDHLAATLAGMASAFCFFRMHHGHGHLNLIWSFWIPLSFIAMDRWVARPTWSRLSASGRHRRPSGARLVVRGGADHGCRRDLPVVARDGRASAERAERIRPRVHGCPDSRSRASSARSSLSRGVAIRASLLHPACRYAGLRVGFIRRSRRLAGAAGEHVRRAMAARAQHQGSALDLGRGDGLPGMDHAWPRRGIGAVVAVRSRDPLERRNRFFIVLAVVAGVLALGPSSSEVASGHYGWSPFGLLAHVPGLSLFRIPARYSQLLNLALASLAAVACAASHRRFGLAGRAATVAAMLLLLAEFYVVNFPGGPPQPFAVPAVYKAGRDAAAGRRPVAAGLREHAALVSRSGLFVLLDRSLAPGRERRLARMAADVSRHDGANQVVPGTGGRGGDARCEDCVRRAARRPARRA